MQPVDESPQFPCWSHPAVPEELLPTVSPLVVGPADAEAGPVAEATSAELTLVEDALAEATLPPPAPDSTTAVPPHAVRRPTNNTEKNKRMAGVKRGPSALASPP